MASGGYRPGAGRPKGTRNAGKVAPAAKASTKAAEVPIQPASYPQDDIERLPLDYMLFVMNDQKADQSRRDRMAIAAAPFLHPKSGELGKKGERQSAAAKVAAGKFAPAAAPRLVVNNK